jgi:hypothetical protein
VLPARFDDTPLPGLLSDMVTVDLRTRTPEQFAAMIAGKLAALGIAAPTPPADAGDAARDVEAAPPAGAVRAGEADPRRLGLHAAISVPGVPEEVLPEYVPRDVDAAEFGVRARVGESAARDIEHRRYQSSPRALLAAASILAVVIAGGVIAVLRYGLVAAIVVLLVVLLAGFRSIRIIPQAMAGIVERFGRYHRTLNPGLNVVVPFADRLRPLVDLRQQAVSFPPQQVLTKGNVIVGIETIIYFHVTDVKAFIYENVNFFWALEQLTVSRLRILVSGMDVETTLASRDQINNELKRELSEAMGKWGIRIDRVELKAIERRP